MRLGKDIRETIQILTVFVLLQTNCSILCQKAVPWRKGEFPSTRQGTVKSATETTGMEILTKCD